MTKNIVLIGYRGCGKTAVAAVLGKKLRLPVISVDDEIIKMVGMSVSDYVNKFGWLSFRDKESEIIRTVGKMNKIIIDCGGGIVTREENIINLKKKGIIFWLKASTPIIIDRIKDDTQRPSITGNKSFIDEVEEILKERNPLYSKAANYEIDTNNKLIEEVAEEILIKIKR